MSSCWNETGWWADQEETELSYARDKLDSLLQILKEDPAKTKTSTKYKDDMASRRDSSEKEKFRSPFYKVSPNDIKRKKRRVPSEEEETYKESFVIKVFERSVDFGQFSENAPLYPMARSWIRNLNQGDSSSWNDVPNVDDDQENSDQLPDCHYTLPKPNDGLTDNDIRIPPPLPPDGQPFLINVEVIIGAFVNILKTFRTHLRKCLLKDYWNSTLSVGEKFGESKYHFLNCRTIL
ncbi:unnamed protein product [Schistosoma rodhaini]|nr:unnamed protein product [Schistosoma rodhaini]